MRRFLLVVSILTLTFGISNGQIFHKNSAKKAEKKQAAKERKLDNDYKKSIEQSKKRTMDIQTPEVKARMKQNQKDTAERNKAKKKKARTSTKKAAKKYK